MVVRVDPTEVCDLRRVQEHERPMPTPSGTRKLLHHNLFVSVLAEDIHVAAPDFRQLVNPLWLNA